MRLLVANKPHTRIQCNSSLSAYQKTKITIIMALLALYQSIREKQSEGQQASWVVVLAKSLVVVWLHYYKNMIKTNIIIKI